MTLEEIDTLLELLDLAIPIPTVTISAAITDDGELEYEEEYAYTN